MNRKPDLLYEAPWEGVPYKFEIFLSDNFSKLKNVSQVYGLVLNDKRKILVVSSNEKSWQLPGGSIEEGETYAETLIREVYEEAAIAICEKSIKPFFYQDVYESKNGKWKYKGTQIRFTAKLERLDKFIEDPGGETLYQKFISIDQLHKYLQWGECSKWMEKELVEIINNQ